MSHSLTVLLQWTLHSNCGDIRDQDHKEQELARIAVMSTDPAQLEHTQHMPQYYHVINNIM